MGSRRYLFFIVNSHSRNTTIGNGNPDSKQEFVDNAKCTISKNPCGTEPIADNCYST